ncbi:Alpha/Beta hydrolase protein [Sporodiniella umbellata]|nr:Alpha/Beta hydrolase protein [Sporodiniella umbellata]
MFEKMACKYGIKMIWPERPGYGLSEDCNSQQVNALEWADVIIQLSNHLGISQFSIIAQSVGTVFALATAYRYKNRVIAPVYLISPWVSTQTTNMFRWTRRLPAALVTRTVSFALDAIWTLNNKSNKVNEQARSKTTVPKQRRTLVTLEEDALLASLEDSSLDLSTDFPTQRPLRHFVRPQYISLYLAMNRRRMEEPYSQGQLCDIMVALEKYCLFGFSYSDVKVSVSAVWGSKDSLIPLKAIDTLASSLQDVHLKILESEGHDLVWKEGVMEWAMRGIAEKWKEKNMWTV